MLCIKESATHCLSVPLFVKFFFLSKKYSGMVYDGYRRGYVSFAHFLLYFMYVFVLGERYCTMLNEEGGRERLVTLIESSYVDSHVRMIALKIIDLLHSTTKS